MEHHSTIFVGMDVHKNSFSICAFAPADKAYFGQTKLSSDYDALLRYLKEVVGSYDVDASLVCGYEAGCTGFDLYRYLTLHGIHCLVVAPNTIKEAKSKRRIKTDKRDARMLAESIAYNSCNYVTVPSQELEDIREYIRMRDDHKAAMKKTKQQIKSFCLRHHLAFANDSWGLAHLQWLASVQLPSLQRETLDEYLVTFLYQKEKVERFDKRIAEIAEEPKYKSSVKNLCCIKGIKTQTAMSIVSEIGDFKRFRSADQFANFIGLVPGEDSSGDKQKRLSITKAGNKHIRSLLVEVAQSYVKGKAGYKSKVIKERQAGCSESVIAYADKASSRLRRKYIKLIEHCKAANVAKTAVARELSGFIWGMMTGHYDQLNLQQHPLGATSACSRQEKPLSLSPKKEVSPGPLSRKKAGEASEMQTPKKAHPKLDTIKQMIADRTQKS